MPFPIVGAGFFLATQGVEEDPQMQPLVLAQLMAKIGEVVFFFGDLKPILDLFIYYQYIYIYIIIYQYRYILYIIVYVYMWTFQTDTSELGSNML